MSIISSQLLSEIVIEKHIYEPNVILENLQNNIVKALKQKNTDNKDGMDLCLCRIEKVSDGKADITFAGAKRALYYYSNETKSIAKLEANRFSIGGINYKKIRTFDNQQVILSKNDIIYLSSDGYVDQNNAERKRFGTYSFITILTILLKKK